MAEEEAEIPYQVHYDGEEEPEEFLTKDGKAKISYPNGDVYEGTYLNGLRHGDGSYVFAKQKGAYNGSWEAGHKTGKGEFKYPDGSRYKGGWNSDKRHGKGTYYYANGDVYCGDWNMGVKCGHGSYVNAADGSKLVGTWSEGKIVEGDWEMKGATYTGKFENGQPVGKGTMKFIIEETLAHVEEGEYVDGKWLCASKNKLALEKKHRSDGDAAEDAAELRIVEEMDAVNEESTAALAEGLAGKIAKEKEAAYQEQAEEEIQTVIDQDNAEEAEELKKIEEVDMDK